MTGNNFRSLLLCALLIFAHVNASWVQAQSKQGASNASVILSDSLTIEANGNIIAIGNVKVFHKKQQLDAPIIFFNKATEQIILEDGGIVRDENGTRFVSKAAELDSDLRNGFVRAANLIVEQQFQMQAEILRRKNGQNTEMEIIRATACTTCEYPMPIWEIRA